MGSNSAVTISATVQDPAWSVPAHGHAPGNLITSTGLKAQANAETTLAAAMVTSVVDVSQFRYSTGSNVILAASIWNATNADNENLQPGEFYFLSEDTQGKITKTQPTSGFVQPVGFAVSETEFVFTAYQPSAVSDETLLQANAVAGNFRVGNMLMQWGKFLSILDTDETITFPIAFDTGTIPIVSATVDAKEQTSATFAAKFTFKRMSNTGFESNRVDDDVSNAMLIEIHWFAVGVSTV